MPKNGKESILLIQATDAATGTTGVVIAQLTEHSHSIENELIDEQTKFGRILGYGQTNESFEFTAYGERGDAGQKVVLDAIKNKKQIKLWEIDTELNALGKHNALFAFGLVESVEKSSPGDGFEELSATVQVMGNSQEGEIDALPPAVINFAQYGFEAPGATTGEFPDNTATP